MFKVKSVVMGALATGAFLFAATSASATQQTYNTGGASINQTNLWRDSSIFSTSGAAPIQSISYTWKLSRRVNGLEVWFCGGSDSNCINLASNTSATSGSGSTSAFNGLPLGTRFYFRFRYNASSTVALSPSVTQGLHSITVTY